MCTFGIHIVFVVIPVSGRGLLLNQKQIVKKFIVVVNT